MKHPAQHRFVMPCAKARLGVWFWSKVFCLAMLCTGAIAQMTLPRHSPHPGGVAVVKLGEIDAPVLDVAYGGNRVLTVKLDDGVFGIIAKPMPR